MPPAARRFYEFEPLRVLGGRDRVCEWLERAAEERATHIAHLNARASSDPIRSDPRFAALAQAR